MGAPYQQFQGRRAYTHTVQLPLLLAVNLKLLALTRAYWYGENKWVVSTSGFAFRPRADRAHNARNNQDSEYMEEKHGYYRFSENCPNARESGA
jgi:hypothetical protein